MYYELIHFEKLSQCKGYDMNKYLTALNELKDELSSLFLDFRKSEKLIELFARPLSVNVIDVPGTH